MKKIFPLLFIISSFIFSNAYAVTHSREGEFPSVYLFHLFYDNGQLFANRNFEFKYDILTEEFVSEEINTSTPYRADIVNFINEIVGSFQFDSQQGDPTFTTGAIDVKAPYFADASRVDFYNSQGQQLLSISVSESSFCNNDGVCNSEIGESPNNCPTDCEIVETPPGTTPSLPRPKIDFLKNLIIYIVIGAGVGSGIWWLLRRKKSASSETLTPPGTSGEI